MAQTLTAQAVRHRILPETLYSDHAIAAWTKAFYQYPVLYHAFQWTTEVHRDLVRNEISASVTKESLRHRILGIQHLKHMLAAPLHGFDLEITLMCLQAFSWSELDQAAMDRMFAQAPLVFEPPILTNDFQVLNRLGRDPRHGAAMEVITRRLGAWANWKLPGLAQTSGIVDLAYASRRATRPLFPPYWVCEKKTPLVDNRRLLVNGQAPGRGFFARIPSKGLPPTMLRLLIQLATIGRVMSLERSKDLTLERKTQLMDRRNAIQYEFLCLPSWDSLDVSTKEASSEAATKSIWLTSIIYVNAVLLGLHGHQGWHTILAARLWTLLTDLSISTWPEDLDDVSLWVLFVGGMAAFRSPARDNYEDALRRVLKRKGNPSWTRVETILHEFMWCDYACRHGASVLWQSL